MAVVHPQYFPVGLTGKYTPPPSSCLSPLGLLGLTWRTKVSVSERRPPWRYVAFAHKSDTVKNDGIWASFYGTATDVWG
jgi:hypothetical protein